MTVLILVREFSGSNTFVLKKEKMLSARLNVVDDLKYFPNQAALIPITNKMV